MNSTTLKLGLVGPLPPPNGGMAMQTLQLARLLREEGVAVELLQTNAPYQPGFIGNVRGVRALFRLVPYLWKAWRIAGRVDVIHLMANSGWSWQLFAAPVIWMGYFRRTPVIVNYRGGEAREYLTRSFSRVRPSLVKASSLVVPSGFLQQVFAEFGINSTVIPNIVDLDVFCPAAHCREPNRFTLVVTRNLENIYGIDTAIRAVASARQHAPGVRLAIAGSGPLKAQLQQLVQELGLEDSVSFLGRLDREQVADLYQSASALLNPARVDNMPNSVLEAMACGLPVISTDVGGVPFVVKHGQTALLVAVDDDAAMAQAIVSLCKDARLQSSLASNGKREVAQYSWPRVGPQWLALYRRIGAAA